MGRGGGIGERNLETGFGDGDSEAGLGSRTRRRDSATGFGGEVEQASQEFCQYGKICLYVGIDLERCGLGSEHGQEHPEVTENLVETNMDKVLIPLIADLLEWLAREPRAYGDVMDAWRTSCPRLTVWEDAVDGGLVCRARRADGVVQIEVTDRGRDFLSQHRENSAANRH